MTLKLKSSLKKEINKYGKNQKPTIKSLIKEHRTYASFAKHRWLFMVYNAYYKFSYKNISTSTLFKSFVEKFPGKYGMGYDYVHDSNNMAFEDIIRMTILYQQLLLNVASKNFIKNLNEVLLKDRYLAYIIFYSSIYNTRVLLVSEDGINFYVILGNHNFFSEKISFAIVIDVTYHVCIFFKRGFPVDIKEKIDTKNSGSDVEIFNDIQQFISRTGTGKVVIDFNNYRPMNLEGTFKVSDLSKANELQKYSSDYGKFGFVYHQGRKVGVEGTKKFVYKDGKKKTDS